MKRFSPLRVGLPVVVLIAVAGMASAERSFDPANPPQGVFIDEWYSVMLQGAQCGFMHSVTRREGDRIVSVSDMQMTIQRDQFKVVIGMSQQYRETLDGRPLSFRQETSLAGQPMLHRGRFRDGKVRLTTEQFGAKQEHTYDIGEGVLMPWGLMLAQRRAGLKPGTKLTFKTYEPTLLAERAIESSVEVVDWEPIDLPTGKTRGLRVKTRLGLSQPMDSVGWVDAEGVPLVMEFSLGAISVRVLRSDRESAKKLERTPELFLNTFVRLDKPVRRDAKRLVLRVSVPEGELPKLPDTLLQRVQVVDARTALVTITRPEWEQVARAAEAKGLPPDVIECLSRSAYLDIDDPRVAELARKARGDSDAPVASAELADRLRRFVSDYIENKNLGVGFATASEVAQTREGDCTEHGVLLAALARANKMPARVVTGLLLVPRTRDQFGYHMWTQVWFGGRWVDLDAAMDQTECDATHLAIGTPTLNAGAALDGAFDLAGLIGRLKIEVVEMVAHDDKSTK